MRLRQLFEAPRTAVVAFGRMNPPTIGHQKLVDKIKSLPGDHYVFLSQSQKPKTDPLSFEDKLRYAKFFFPNVTVGHPEVKTIIQAMQKLEQLGYERVIYVAGSDRVDSFTNLLNQYNGQADKSGNIPYSFKLIKVVSAGERDPDADGAEGMSASKMRQAAADNDLESFKQGVPQPQLADEMFAAVKQGMGIRDAVPAESISESVAQAEWYVLTANSGDRLTGPLADNAAQQQAIVYPAKPPQIGPAPQGFKTVIAQATSSNLNMAMTKAQLQIKKIYARQFGDNVQNLSVNMSVVKFGGRAVDQGGKGYVATVSAHIKKEPEMAEGRFGFGEGDPIEAPEWLNDENKALWATTQPTTKDKRLVTQLEKLQRFIQAGLTDQANQVVARELSMMQREDINNGH